jgi:hypothetical protein
MVPDSLRASRPLRCAVEQAHHVLDGIDGHAHFSNLAHGQRIIGVQPDLRRQVESHAQPGGALAQEILVAPVRLLGIAHAGILPHRPEPAAIHGRLHAARVGELPRIADIAIVVGAFQIGRGVKRLNVNVR